MWGTLFTPDISLLREMNSWIWGIRDTSTSIGLRSSWLGFSFWGGLTYSITPALFTRSWPYFHTLVFPRRVRMWRRSDGPVPTGSCRSKSAVPSPSPTWTAGTLSRGTDSTDSARLYILEKGCMFSDHMTETQSFVKW